jgi:hypothetical protein
MHATSQKLNQGVAQRPERESGELRSHGAGTFGRTRQAERGTRVGEQSRRATGLGEIWRTAELGELEAKPVEQEAGRIRRLEKRSSTTRSGRASWGRAPERQDARRAEKRAGHSGHGIGAARKQQRRREESGLGATQWSSGERDPRAGEKKDRRAMEGPRERESRAGAVKPARSARAPWQGEHKLDPGTRGTETGRWGRARGSRPSGGAREGKQGRG